MSDFTKWTCKEVQDWIRKQKFSPSMIEEDALAKLKDCNGEILNEIKTKEDLVQLKVKNVCCRSILKAIDKLRLQTAAQQQEEMERMVKEQEAKKGKQKLEFYVQFSSSKSVAKKSKKKFKLTSTLGELKQYWVDQESGGVAKDLIFTFNRIQYSSDKDHLTLADIHVNCNNNLISLVWRTKGGMAQVGQDEKMDGQIDEDPLTRERLADFKHDKIKPSLEADCLMGYNERELRVKMPCGHVFAPLTIYQLTQRIFNKLGEFEVRCPLEKCDQLWTFDVLVAGGGFNESESSRFQRIFNNRAAIGDGDTQECPNCNALTKRPNDLHMQRVRCKNNQCKNASDFCWVCGQSWIGGGFRVCGNKNCSTGYINEELKNSPMTTTMPNFENQEIRKLRACPNCFMKILYKKACKHMKCAICKTDFCFVCLRKKENGKWQCRNDKGELSYRCSPAPVQTIK